MTATNFDSSFRACTLYLNKRNPHIGGGVDDSAYLDFGPNNSITLSSTAGPQPHHVAAASIRQLELFVRAHRKHFEDDMSGVKKGMMLSIARDISQRSPASSSLFGLCYFFGEKSDADKALQEFQNYMFGKENPCCGNAFPMGSLNGF